MPRVATIIRITVRSLCVVTCAYLLSACTIEKALPDLDYQVTDKTRAAGWPKLVDQREFAREVREIAPEDEIETLQTRSENLQLRAEALQKPVISDKDKTRLQQAAGQ